MNLGVFKMKLIFLSFHFQIFRGSKNAYNYAAIRQVDGGITARVVRLIPLNSVVQACMRVQLCGKCKGPFLYSGGGECDTVIIQPFCTKCWYTGMILLIRKGFYCTLWDSLELICFFLYRLTNLCK